MSGDIKAGFDVIVIGAGPAGAVLARRDEIINRLDDSAQVPWLEGRGVTVIRGHGRLAGERRVRVGEALYEAHRAHVLSEILAGRPGGGIADTPGAPPQVIFTDPQIATVGLTLAGALESGLDAHAYDVPTSGTAGASFSGRGAAGTSRLVVDERRGVIVGATFVGPDVAEWLHAASIAILGELPVERLWAAIPAFPTRSEVWLKLLEAREAERATRPELTVATP